MSRVPMGCTRKSKENEESGSQITEVADTHRGHRRPRLRGWGRQLAALIPNPSRTPSRRSPIDSGLGPLIGDLDPSIEVAGILHGYRRPRSTGWSCRLAAPIPNPPRTLTGDLRLGILSRFGVGVANRRPRPLHRDRRRPLWVPTTSVEGLWSLIGDTDPYFPFDFLYRTKMKS
ncbi:hypothetical protein CRG98_034623 [Punica granatum]|uniref:Uncharacterized protein n=1 Tax=Punica granatum TaxID=22663 RepID=A0A2I0ILV1_PUNGR|nr:hypothetical protein CRG98_034623 [Punica granatum]